MVADGYDDCEGDLLQRVRAIVGPDVVVGAELDPHVHLTRAMVGNADVLVAFKEYPHTDIVERASELVDLCDAALVEVGGIDILLITLRNQAMDTDVFTQLGCDLVGKKIIVVKSAQHFHASFAKVARHVIYAGAPGTATPHLSTLPYRKIKRPIWPLDDIATPTLVGILQFESRTLYAEPLCTQ